MKIKIEKFYENPFENKKEFDTFSTLKRLNNPFLVKYIDIYKDGYLSFVTFEYQVKCLIFK